MAIRRSRSALSFAVLALLLAVVFVMIAVQAGSEVAEKRVHDVGYWLRKRWLALLLVIGVVVVGISLFDLPFATGSDAGRTVVKVTGGQFFWSLSPDRVPVGTPRPLRRHLGRRQPRLRPLRPARAPDRVGAGDARLPQRARSRPGRCRRLPDPLPRALRAEPLDDAEHVHGDAPLMEAAVAPAPQALHPGAIAFTGPARGIERRIGLLFAATGSRAHRGDGRARPDHAADPGHRDQPFARLVLPAPDAARRRHDHRRAARDDGRALVRAARDRAAAARTDARHLCAHDRRRARGAGRDARRRLRRRLDVPAAASVLSRPASGRSGRRVCSSSATCSSAPASASTASTCSSRQPTPTAGSVRTLGWHYLRGRERAGAAAAGDRRDRRRDRRSDLLRGRIDDPGRPARSHLRPHGRDRRAGRQEPRLLLRALDRQPDHLPRCRGRSMCSCPATPAARTRRRRCSSPAGWDRSSSSRPPTRTTSTWTSSSRPGPTIISEVASYGALIPVAVITIYSMTMLIWGSRYHWTLASTLLYIGFAGWAIGGVGAVIDSIIPINFRLHNTTWVVAHFHTYLILCVVVWAARLPRAPARTRRRPHLVARRTRLDGRADPGRRLRTDRHLVRRGSARRPAPLRDPAARAPPATASSAPASRSCSHSAS